MIRRVICVRSTCAARSITCTAALVTWCGRNTRSNCVYLVICRIARSGSCALYCAYWCGLVRLTSVHALAGEMVIRRVADKCTRYLLREVFLLVWIPTLRAVVRLRYRIYIIISLPLTVKVIVVLWRELRLTIHYFLQVYISHVRLGRNFETTRTE